MHHTYQALERCIVLPQRGKLFCRTTALHMWLQFEQQLKIWHQSRRCIICHLIMSHHWKARLIFPKVKNSNGICVIVFHLKSNPNVGCKREMRREMERATAPCRTIQLCEREQNWLQWSCWFLFLHCCCFVKRCKKNLKQQLTDLFYTDILSCSCF